MIKFKNEKSEKLYYKLLDRYGKDRFISDGNKRKLRFPIDKKLGINRTLFALAEYTEGRVFKNKESEREKKRELIKNKIRNLEFNASEASRLINGTTASDIIKQAIERSKDIFLELDAIEIDNRLEKAIEDFIIKNGYLFTKNLLEEKLSKLIEKIKVQQTNLREANDALSEAEAKKEQCLVLLYGTTTEKEG